jgi:hypothetical protein
MAEFWNPTGPGAFRVIPTGSGVVHSFEKECSPYRTPTARLGEDIAAAEQLELSDTARGRGRGGDVTEHLASTWVTFASTGVNAVEHSRGQPPDGQARPSPPGRARARGRGVWWT